MATFYVLPSRRFVGQRFGDYLGNLFPGLSWDGMGSAELAELLGALARSHTDVYVIFRDDLPDSDDLSESLERDFGLEPSDDVIEVSAFTDEFRPQIRRAA